MAGYSRPEGGWSFEYQGLNTVDAADQLQPVNYPVAVNIRSLPDHHIETRPGYEYFIALLVIGDCPDAAVSGVPYTFTCTATGGVPPYTWQIISGSLPDGLTLDSSTGVISGTPTEDGDFDFTIQVTDSAGTTLEKDCSIHVDPPTTCSLTARLPFVMADGVRFRSGTIDKTYETTGVLIDTAQYPGMTQASWEICVKILAGTATDTKQWTYDLVDESANVYATITTPIMSVPVITTVYALDPVVFTPLSGSHFYALKVRARPSGPSASAVELTSGIINLDLTDSAIWRIEIPMFIGGNFETVVGATGSETQSNIDSYQVEWDGGLFCLHDEYSEVEGEQPGDGRQFGWQLFKYEAGKWPATVTFELEVKGLIQDQHDGLTYFLALMDNDTNDVVLDSQVNVTATSSPTRYVTSFATSATNFIDGHTYRVAVRASIDTCASGYKGFMDMYRCKLYAVLAAPASDGGNVQVYFSNAGNVMASQISGGLDYFIGARLRMDLTKFDPLKTTWYFDQSSFVPVTDPGSTDLLDMGAASSGISSPSVAATVALDPGNSEFNLFQTPFTPVDGHYYIVRETSSFCSSMGRVMVEVVC